MMIQKSHLNTYSFNDTVETCKLNLMRLYLVSLQRTNIN